MPVFCRMASAYPAFSISAQIAAPRAHCHTMALYSGFPVSRSHAMEVSRWLLIPRTAISSFGMPAFTVASRAACSVFCQISSGLCSTQPRSLIIC